MAKHSSSTEETELDTFAEDLGHVLGKAKHKANSWLDQRIEIIKHLEAVRDTASALLRQLGEVTHRTPSKQISKQTSMPRKRKSSSLSPEARERIAAAQRKRWAKFRREHSK